MKNTTKTLLTIGAVAFMGVPAYGANLNWDGGAGTVFWDDANNWSPNQAPTLAADAAFMSDNVVVVRDAQVIFRDNVNSTAGNSGSLTIGSGGSLTMANGQRINWSGANSVGDSTVTVENGGSLSAGFFDTNQGSGSTATFEVLSGGTATFSSTFSMNDAAGTGNVVVDGAGSTITVAGNTNIVGSATNTLTISNGGTFATGANFNYDPTNLDIGGGGSRFELGTGGTGGAMTQLNSITIASGGTFAVNQSDAVTQGTEFGNTITGAGSFEQSGIGTTTLNVANGHSGGTTLSAGTLVLGDAAAAGTGTLTLSGGTLEMAANIANDISATGSTAIVNNTGTLSLSGGAVTGTGTLAFSVANQTRLFSDLSGFSGTISHDNDAGGQLRLWNQVEDLSGTKIVTSGGTSGGGLQFIGSGAHTIGELSGTGGRILMRGGSGLTLTIDQSTDTTYSGVLQDGDTNRKGSLVKDGSGTLTLDGANTYTGGTTINAGTLRFGNTGALGTGTLTLSGGTLDDHTGSNATYGLSAIVVSDATSTAIINTNGGDTKLGGAVSGAGTLNFGGSGDGQVDSTVRLTGGLSGFTGTITHDNVVAGNRLFLDNTGTTSASIFTSGYTGSSAGIRILNAATISELSGTGGRVAGWNSTLTINQSSNTTYSGRLDDFQSGKALTLIKDGSGTLTLNFANTYTGTTTVDTGTLIIDGIQSSATGAMTINVNGTLGGSGTIGASLLTVNGVIAPGNSPGTLATGSQLWNIGGSYLWEINDSDGSKGLSLGGTNGWDWLDITGDLNLASLSAGGFTIDIDSLNSSDLTGTADGFDYSGLAYGDAYGTTFIIATADTITDFEAGDFILDDSGFVNGKLEWSISESGTDLVLSAVFVPEPSSTALLGLGLSSLLVRRKRSAA